MHKLTKIRKRCQEINSLKAHLNAFLQGHTFVWKVLIWGLLLLLFFVSLLFSSSFSPDTLSTFDSHTWQAANNVTVSRDLQCLNF